MNLQYIAGADLNIDRLFADLKAEKPDMYVSIGGDGTVIRTFKKMVENKHNVPVLVLAGGTVNFLSNKSKDYKKTFQDLQNGLNFYEYKFKPLEIIYNNQKYLAINDVLIGNSLIDFNTIHIDTESISLDNTTFQGAGINICTEIGSTGFHMNNGGQIFFDNNLFGITSVVASKKINEVIPAQELKITAKNSRSNIKVFIDGSSTILSLEKGGQIIIRQSNEYYSLGFLEENQLKNKKIKYLDTNRLRYK